MALLSQNLRPATGHHAPLALSSPCCCEMEKLRREFGNESADNVISLTVPTGRRALQTTLLVYTDPLREHIEMSHFPNTSKKIKCSKIRYELCTIMFSLWGSRDYVPLNDASETIA